MGTGFSNLFPCFNPAAVNRSEPDFILSATEPLDETLGHSFCYIRSSARFISPSNSNRFISPSQSLRFSEPVTGSGETGFKAISGASVSANTYTPRTVLQLDDIYDNATGSTGSVKGSIVNGFESTSSFCALPLQPVRRGGGEPVEPASSMERAFFMSCPIERGALSGPLDGGDSSGDSGGGGGGANRVPFSAPLSGIYVNKRNKKDISGIRKAFFMSGPIERGALSGPLDGGDSGGGGGGGRGNGVPYSAPLSGIYVNKRKKKGVSGIRKAFYRVVPVRNFFIEKKECSCDSDVGRDSNVQWALGKAGEDRVHVVVSEEHGWLFVGIYDGFNGPDGPEFLMSNLYKAMYKELEGLFWDNEETRNQEVIVEDLNELNLDREANPTSRGVEESGNEVNLEELDKGLKKMATFQSGEIVVRRRRLWDNEETSNQEVIIEGLNESNLDQEPTPMSRGVEESENEVNLEELDKGLEKRVAFQSGEIVVRRRRLWEYLAEAETEDDGLDLSGSDRFAFSVDDALSVNSAGSAVNRRSLLLSKLKNGLLIKHKESKRLFPWKFGLQGKEKVDVGGENRVEERSNRSERRRKVGPVDHELVLRAMSRALEVTELAYLDMTDKVLDRYPELALMGSCLLVALMRDEDVYIMNVGDSRAIVAQYEPEEVSSSSGSRGLGNSELAVEGIVEEPVVAGDEENKAVNDIPTQAAKLTALQLSTDHSTSIEEEVTRIKNEHPDDSNCIVNDRVKGRLKVTRAFGAGFLKKPKLNEPLLEMFRNEYIGDAPYLSCTPSLRHHRLCPRDQFLVLSSDGLYQYLSNQEVVCHVENFMEKFPDGDPAQHLIEELLFRAAKKAGMDLHELLDIPQGDRRKYHDDVTVMVVSLEGRIWKSSGKYL